VALTDLLQRMDFGRLSTRERALFILTVIAVLFAYFAFLMMPMIHSARDLTAQKISLKAETDRGMAQIPMLQKQSEELRQAKAREVSAEFSGKAGDLFPGGSRLSSLLEEMTRLARLRRIEFIAIRPDAIVDKGSYLQLNFQMDVQCRFRELGDYLLMLENLPRAIVVNELKIESRADLNPAVLAHLKAVTYLGKE